MRNLTSLLKKVQNNKTFISLLITILFTVCFFSIFTPIYDVNDDVFFTMIANGSYTKTPSSYLFVPNVILGKLFVFLYTKWESVNWYSIFMYLVATVSLFVILKIIFERVSNKLYLFISIIGVLSLSIRIFIFLSFTIISAWATICGFFLIISLLTQNTRRSYIWIWYFLSFMLLLAGSLIREASFDMVSILSIPTLLYISKDKKLYRKQAIIFAVILLISIVLTRSIINKYPQNSVWKKAMSGPNYSFLFYAPSISNYDANKKVYSLAGFSKNDYDMFYNFFYDDEVIFPWNKISFLLHNINKYPLNQVANIPITLLQSLLTIGPEILLYIFFAMIFLKRNQYRNLNFITLGITLLIISFFSYRDYLPSRVVFSIYLYLFILLIYSIPKDIHIHIQKLSNRNFILHICLIAILIAVISVYGEMNSYNKIKINSFKKIVATLPNAQNDLTFIWGSSIPYAWLPVFDSYEVWKKKNILIGAWQQRTVYNEEIKKKFNIKNVQESLVNNHDFYLIADQEQKKMLQIFMKEHYNRNIQYKVIQNYRQYYYNSELLQVIEK